MSWVSVLDHRTWWWYTRGPCISFKKQTASALRPYLHSTRSTFCSIDFQPSFRPSGLAESHLHSHAECELAILLLVVVRRQTARGEQAQRHRRAGTSLDDAGNGRGGEEDAAAQSELGAVVLVVLEEIAWEEKRRGLVLKCSWQCGTDRKGKERKRERETYLRSRSMRLVRCPRRGRGRSVCGCSRPYHRRPLCAEIRFGSAVLHEGMLWGTWT